jgi:lysozyme
MLDTEILTVAVPQIQSDEGCRLQAYPDPLSGGDPYTVGFGATGPSITADTVWTQDQANADLEGRCTAICSSLDITLPWWRGLDTIRAAVLVNMQYQLGSHGLLGFPHALAAIQAGQWAEASNQMLNSTWARQTPNRAKRLAAQILSGVQTYP